PREDVSPVAVDEALEQVPGGCAECSGGCDGKGRTHARLLSSQEPSAGRRFVRRAPSPGARGAARKSSSGLRRRQGDEQAAVVVERGEEVPDDALHLAASGAELELLVEPAHSPLERELDGVLLLLEALEPEGGDHLGTHHVLLVPAAQLEDAAAEREDPALLVARDEARGRRGVIVVHQLEEEAE